jgi:hypothetical protein
MPTSARFERIQSYPAEQRSGQVTASILYRSGHWPYCHLGLLHRFFRHSHYIDTKEYSYEAISVSYVVYDGFSLDLSDPSTEAAKRRMSHAGI